MNDSYSEVRDYLRQEHAKNTNEIYGRNVPAYSGYHSDVQENTEKNFSWALSFKGKIILFLSCVMLFSCYIYGGQDVKKGAVMAFHDAQRQITIWEEKEPVVKDAVTKVEGFYDAVYEYLEAYLTSIEETDEGSKQ